MIPHIFYHLGIWMAFSMCCLFGFSSSTSNVTDAPQVPMGLSSCYQGTIESNLKGQIPLDGEEKLTRHACDPIATTVATTVAPTTQADSGKQTPEDVGSTVSPAATRNVSCAVLMLINGAKVTADVTLTFNFTCGTSEDCPPKISNGKQFCCSGPDCNSLQFFQKSSGKVMATVDTCLTGSQTSEDTGALVVSTKCEGQSHYCFNSTNGDRTSFGCGNIQMEKKCQSSSPCSEDGNLTVCCCDSNDCNGPPRSASVHPTPMVPSLTTPLLVTVNKTYSNWMLITFIAAGFLIGGLMGVFVMVLCRKWKRKRANGPLQISYSRVSADLTVEDDDNIFSY